MGGPADAQPYAACESLRSPRCLASHGRVLKGHYRGGGTAGAGCPVLRRATQGIPLGHTRWRAWLGRTTSFATPVKGTRERYFKSIRQSRLTSRHQRLWRFRILAITWRWFEISRDIQAQARASIVSGNGSNPIQKHLSLPCHVRSIHCRGFTIVQRAARIPSWRLDGQAQRGRR